MDKVLTIALLSFLAGCGPNLEDYIVTVDEVPVKDPTITFGHVSGYEGQLSSGLECALERVRVATCLPVAVSLSPQHWVKQKPVEDMGGRGGWTLGKWEATTISLKEGMNDQGNCDVLIHEIGQHILRRRNDDGHIEPTFSLSEELLTDICTKQECGCFVPEVGHE